MVITVPAAGPLTFITEGSTTICISYTLLTSICCIVLKNKFYFHYLHCPPSPPPQLTPKREITPQRPPRSVHCAPLIWIQFQRGRRWQACCGTTDRDHCKRHGMRGHCGRLQRVNRCVLMEETRRIDGI